MFVIEKGYTSPKGSLVSCCPLDTPIRERARPRTMSISCPAGPHTCRLVSAYSEWPSETRQPAVAVCDWFWTSTTMGRPPPSSVVGQRAGAGCRGVVVDTGAGSTCTLHTGTTRPSGMNSCLGT
ncbi:Uncharacterised protein [Mycobacteroides abscessus subsp. abscessus]|nr:Uncharacterised protein [Mycobacteroides abscessus subsp. abscessus]